jgi:hypothetical protein
MSRRVPASAAPNGGVKNEHQSVTDKVILRALGAELRLAREERGWSRAQFARRLPSGICDRTVVSYELGARCMDMLRLIELCHAPDHRASADEDIGRAGDRALQITAR